MLQLLEENICLKDYDTVVPIFVRLGLQLPGGGLRW